MRFSKILNVVSSLGLTMLALLILSQPSRANPDVETAWRLLDYIAVDYREAVHDGQVVNPEEYTEMLEFAKSAKERIDELSDSPKKVSLQKDALALQQAIEQKVSPHEVAKMSRGLAANLITAYPVPLAPAEVPDVSRGAKLYVAQCASCHGTSGDGLGPAAVGMEPPPIAFLDKERASQRSIFGLYQVIEQGLDDTPMVSYKQLPAEDKWALAFYVGSMAYQEQKEAGKTDFESNKAFADSLTMKEFVGLTPSQLTAQLGTEEAEAIMGYLRSTPEALEKAPAGSLSLSRMKLAQSLAAYEEGDKKAATELALSAYLDGFEPVEAILSTKDKALLSQVEGAMGTLRSSIDKNASLDEVKTKVGEVEELLIQVEEALEADSGSWESSFFGALAILLREGLEALLLVVAMLGFLRKAERPELVPYLHGGWVSALLAGLATWGVATWLIGISGATREMTEGLGSVLAALILLWVGVWMHGKSNAQAWQEYVKDTMTQAIGKGSAWFLFGLAFLVVYREVFETILFYSAMWSQGHGDAVLAGAGVATALLAAVAAALLAFSKRLPIEKFFTYSSFLIAVLAVVLIGKGVSALQETGMISLTLLNGFPRVELLGMYPTMETAGAQAAMIALLLAGIAYNNRVSFNR